MHEPDKLFTLCDCHGCKRRQRLREESWARIRVFSHDPRQFPGNVSGCAFSPDGRYALSASEDHSLHLWDVANGQEVRQFIGHDDPVNDCAFSPDGRYVLSASMDQTLRLWEVASGLEVRQFAGHSHSVGGCAFSADGRYALSASSDDSLRLWDVTTGTQKAVWYGDAPNLCCAFSPQGDHVMAGDFLGGAHLFMVVGLEATASVPQSAVALTAPSPATSAPQGEHATTTGELSGWTVKH
jgi:WD40 repeat protein